MKNIAIYSLAIVALGVGLFFTSDRLAAYPQPARLAVSWQLDVTYERPHAIAVRGLDGRIRWYFYFAYKIVNQSKREQFFVPDVTLATDQGDIITANRGIPPRVFAAIKKRLGNRLLEDPSQVSGQVLIGEDHARQSVAIWRAFDHDVDRMTVFFAGLSGEIKTIKRPGTDKDVTLRKTLMLSYHTPGTPAAGITPQFQSFRLDKERWVMR